MKMRRCIVAVVSAVSITAFANFEWPDAAATPEPVIPSGETVEVTDVSVINAYTSVTIDEGATLKLATATPPTTTLKGAGAIEKVSDAVWTMTKAQTGFTGSYYLKAGVVTNGVEYTFGYGAASASAVTIYVNGGTLVIPANAVARIFYCEKLHIAGTGANGMGAIVANKGSTNSELLRNGITLDDDATITFNDYLWPRGNLKLNGHTLTCGGPKTGAFYYLSRGYQIIGPGNIRIAKTGSSYRDFYFRPSPATSSPAFFTETDPLTRFLLEPYARLQVYCDDATGKIAEYATPIKADIHVDGGTARLYHTHRYTYPTNEFYHTKPVTWEGAVTFKDSDSELCVVNHTDAIYCEQNIVGPISGPGKLRIGVSDESRNPGRVRLSNPTNSYAGRTLAYLGTHGSFALQHTNSLPNYLSFTCSNGRVSLLLADEDNNWTTNAVVKLANEATLQDGAALSLDGIAATGENLTVSTENGWLSAITNSGVRLGAEHGASLDVYGPVSGTGPHGFVAPPGGTVRFHGGGKMELGYLSDRGPNGDASLFEFNGADATIISNGMYAGAGTPTRIALKNGASIVMGEGASEITTSGSKHNSKVASYAIRLGCASGLDGVLEIDSTSFISNRVAAGNSSGACGAVYQRGGTVFATSGTYEDSYSSYSQIGGFGHGYWEVSESGKLVFTMRPMIGYKSPGILHIDGGSTVSMKWNEISTTTRPWLYLSYDSPGVVYIKDGKLNLSPDTYPVIGGASKNWRATVTVDGTNAHYLATSTYHVGWSTGGGGHFYVNMNAGLFESSAIKPRPVGNIPTRTNPDVIYLNFNGGTFKSRDAAPFPEIRNPTNNYWFVASIYGGGATIDTDTNKTTINIPLKGATGNGVSAIALPAEIADRTFVAPPYIAIAGDGEGATAYAVFNSRTGKVTGVRVTSPGINYTDATASFIVGGTTLATATCTLAANTSGDFTKVGQYDLILNGTNTWGGRTVLANGKLTSGVNHALPADSTYVMAGGYLNMNNKTLSDDSAYPSKWAVDLNQVRDSGTVTYAGNISFPAGATIEVIGGETLTDTDARSMTLLRMTGTVTGEPAITGVTDPRWNASLQNGVLKLRRFTGTMFSIR